MEIKLNRIFFSDKCTVGDLEVNGKIVANTLEPKYIDLRTEAKVPSHTAIPEGRYELLRQYSPKFRQMRYFLRDVPLFSGVMIHEGNYVWDTRGCILVGRRLPDMQFLADSRKTLEKLNDMLDTRWFRPERLYIDIRNAG